MFDLYPDESFSHTARDKKCPRAEEWFPKGLSNLGGSEISALHP